MFSHRRLFVRAAVAGLDPAAHGPWQGRFFPLGIGSLAVVQRQAAQQRIGGPTTSLIGLPARVIRRDVRVPVPGMNDSQYRDQAENDAGSDAARTTSSRSAPHATRHQVATPAERVGPIFVSNEP